MPAYAHFSPYPLMVSKIPELMMIRMTNGAT